MGIDVFRIVANSLQALVGNKTVLVYAAAGGILSALLSAMLVSQSSALSSVAGTQSFTAILPVLAAFLGAAAVGILILFLVNIFITGAVITAANGGNGVDVGAAAKQAANRYLSLLGTQILVGIAVGIGFILLIIPGIFLLVKLSIAPVEAVAGRKGVFDALQSSWNRTDGRFWSILGAFIVMFIAVLIISGVISLIFTLAGLRPVANFVSVFVGFAVTVMLVQIYQALPGEPKAQPAQRKRQRK